MSEKAFQRIYTHLTAITKATVTLEADGVTADDLALVAGRLAQVVKIKGRSITLQVFGGTEDIPDDGAAYTRSRSSVSRQRAEGAGQTPGREAENAKGELTNVER